MYVHAVISTLFYLTLTQLQTTSVRIRHAVHGPLHVPQMRVPSNNELTLPDSLIHFGISSKVKENKCKKRIGGFGKINIKKFKGHAAGGESSSLPPVQSTDHTTLHCILYTQLMLSPRVVDHIPFIIERDNTTRRWGTQIYINNDVYSARIIEHDSTFLSFFFASNSDVTPPMSNTTRSYITLIGLWYGYSQSDDTRYSFQILTLQ